MLAATGPMRPLLLPAVGVLLALLVACTSDSMSGDSTPEGDADPTPTVDVPRPAFRLEFYDTTGTAEWEEVEAAAGFRLGGHVTWWPSCDLSGSVEPVEIEIEEELPPDTLTYALPRPDDDAYTHIKDFLLLVYAVDEEDDIIGYQNTGQSNERLCPQ